MKRFSLFNKRAFRSWLLTGVKGALAVFLVTLLVSIAASRWVQSKELAQIETTTRIVAENLAGNIRHWIDARLGTVRQLAANTTVDYSDNPEAFRAIVEPVHEYMSGIQAINWIDLNGIIRVVVPLEENPGVLNSDLKAHPREDVLRALAETGDMRNLTRTLANLPLLQGGTGFTTYTVARDVNGNALGFVNGVFRIDVLMEEVVGNINIRDGFDFELMEEDGTIIVREDGQTSPIPDTLRKTIRIEVADRPWFLTVSPTNVLIADSLGLSRFTILFGGALFGIILALAYILMVRDKLDVKSSEARYRAIVEDQTELILRCLPDGTITFVNEAFCRYFKTSGDVLFGKKFLPLIPEADQSEVLQFFDSLDARNPVASHVHRVIMPDGGFRWHKWTIRVLLDDAGKAIEFQGTGRDVTERREAEEALRESERLLLESQSVAHIGSYVLDIPSGIWKSSPTLDHIFGIGPDYERSIEGWTRIVHPEQREAMFHYWIHDVLNSRGMFDIEYKIVRHNDGIERYVQGKGKVEYDAQDKPLRMVGTIQDITDRKRAEEERISLERQVQHAQKLESLGVLAGGIAHDFNNLLMSILGNADLALDELAPHAPARDNILEIEKASKRAADLAKQMLAYSGRGQFVIESIKLNEFVAEMAHLLEVSISKKVALKYHFDHNVPPIKGDAAQIRQIIMNLITNASEAIGDKSGIIALSTGSIHCDRAYLNSLEETVYAGLDAPLPEGIYTYLEVADTGCGMENAVLQRVFDPFFTTKFTGRGLGMSAVLGIVRGHKGAIKIHSEVGKGTAFTILFPAQDPIDGAVNLVRTETDEDVWRAGGTVLIVDDEKTVCEVGKKMLERLGFSVLTAADGFEALEIFRQRADEIACVLLDLTMPHMDGEEAFRELRLIRSNVKVILCSGYSIQEVTERFADQGLTSFLQKPYNLATLKERLKEILHEA